VELIIVETKRPRSHHPQALTQVCKQLHIEKVAMIGILTHTHTHTLTQLWLFGENLICAHSQRFRKHWPTPILLLFSLFIVRYEMIYNSPSPEVCTRNLHIAQRRACLLDDDVSKSLGAMGVDNNDVLEVRPRTKVRSRRTFWRWRGKVFQHRRI
jgi:hypothetical protein